MKKLLVLFLILAMVPAIAFGETDPIVGAWYLFIDATAFPEYKPTLTTTDYLVGVYIFKEDGTIATIETDLIDNDFPDNIMNTSGTWSNENGVYSCRILSLGTCELYLENDELHISRGEGYYILMRKLVPYNIYKDVVVH